VSAKGWLRAEGGEKGERNYSDTTVLLLALALKKLQFTRFLKSLKA
jgi:hypothetical protein